MAIAVKRATIGCGLGADHVAGSNVGIQDGIHIICSGSICHQLLEYRPIRVVTNDETVMRIVSGRCIGYRTVAVLKHQLGVSRYACPCLTTVVLSVDMVGGEETVLYAYLTAGRDKAHETAVIITVRPFKAAVEETVAECQISVFLHHSDKATVGGIAVDAGADSHGRAAPVNSDGGILQNLSYEACREHIDRVTHDAGCAQVSERGIADKAERSHEDMVGRQIDIQRMAVAVKMTPVRIC